MNLILFKTVRSIFQLIDFLIFARIILSWLPIGRNMITNLIYNLTEPLLYPIRELIRKSPLGSGLMLDFSPIILFLILSLVERLIYSFIL